MTVGERIASWIAKESARYVVQSFTAPGGEIVAHADRCYVRVWLVEMMLGASRRWFTEWQPAVNGRVQMKFGDRAVELTKLAAPIAGGASGRAVLQNYVLLDLCPYRGGTIELEASLLALQGKDHLALALGVVSDFASLIAPPLAASLQLAGKVKESVGRLFDRDGEVQLAYHNTLAADALRASYIAIVGAEARDVPPERLSVIGDRLCLDREPLTGRDHMLLRIELATTRDDFMAFGDIESLRETAIKAFIEGDAAKGEAALQAAVLRAATHPDLINADRRALSVALRDDIQAYRVDAVPRSGDGWAAFVNRIVPLEDHDPVTVADVLAP